MSNRSRYPYISKIKEMIEGRKQKILSLVDDNKNNSWNPSSKEIIDIDGIDIESIMREKKERKREGEEEY